MGVKEDLVDLLKDELSASALTKDDNTTNARYEPLVVNPPYVTAKDMLLTKGYDLLFTVADLRAENKRILQNIPLVEDGRYLIKTWTIEKKNSSGTVIIDGLKLKQKADDEVKRVFKENPYDASGNEQSVVGWENADKMVNGMWVYSTVFTVRKRVF